MGNLTTITISNDALHAFEDHAPSFGLAILHGIEKADREQQEVPVPFFNYANYINVQKPRHADDHTVFVHCGNCVTNINAHDKDFKELAESAPQTALKFIKIAEEILKQAKAFAKAKLEQH